MTAPTAIERHNNQINDTDLEQFLFQLSFEDTNIWVSNRGLMHAILIGHIENKNF